MQRLKRGLARHAISSLPEGPAPAVDQQVAGAMMWALAMVIDSIWMMVAAVEWWRSEERKTAILERRESEEVPR